MLAAHVRLLVLTWVASECTPPLSEHSWGSHDTVTVAVDVLPLLLVCLHGVILNFTLPSTDCSASGGSLEKRKAVELSYLVLSSLPSPGVAC